MEYLNEIFEIQISYSSSGIDYSVRDPEPAARIRMSSSTYEAVMDVSTDDEGSDMDLDQQIDGENLSQESNQNSDNDIENLPGDLNLNNGNDVEDEFENDFEDIIPGFNQNLHLNFNLDNDDENEDDFVMMNHENILPELDEFEAQNIEDQTEDTPLKKVKKAFINFMKCQFVFQKRNHLPDCVIEQNILSFKISQKIVFRSLSLDQEYMKAVDAIPKSIETMRTRLGIFRPKIQKYHFCSDGLFGPFYGQKYPPGASTCTGPGSHVVATSTIKKTSYFCMSELKIYLEYLLPKIYHLLRFSKPDESKPFIHDVIDGSEYSRLWREDQITLIIGWDGGALSRKKHFWPLVSVNVLCIFLYFT